MLLLGKRFLPNIREIGLFYFFSKNKIAFEPRNIILQFLNDFESWRDNKGGQQTLIETYGENIPRMPREMFYQLSDSPLARYSHLAENADFCSNLDLTTEKGFMTYKSHWKCKNPWNRPGLAEITSACGVSGGLQNRMKELYPYGQPAETYSYPNAPTTQWKRGESAKVNSRFCI